MYKYYVFLWVSRTLARLPPWFTYRLATVIGEVAYLVNRRARRCVQDNLRHVLGPEASPARIRNLARGVFHHTTYYYCDLVRLPHLDVVKFSDGLVFHGYERLDCAVATGRGVILVSGHYGNPELVVQSQAPRGLCVMALTEPLNPPALSALFDGWRSRFGHQFRPVSLSAVKAAMRTLRQGGVVAILGDRDIQATGVVVPFCGEPTRVPVGPVEMALRTGAVLLPVFTRRIKFDRFEVTVQEPLELVRTGNLEEDIRTNVEALLARFEPHLRQEPRQWIVLERVWDGA